MRTIRDSAAGLLTACALATGINGCGQTSSSPEDTSDGSGGTGGAIGLVMGEPVTREEFKHEKSRIFCEWMATCCNEFELSVDADECTKRIDGLSEPAYSQANPDHFAYDPNVGGECLAAQRELYRNWSCANEETPVRAMLDVNALCDSIYVGKLEPGTTCTSRIECAKSLGDWANCTDLDIDEAPVCVIERRAGEGEACYWTCTEYSPGVRGCSMQPGSAPAFQGQCFTNDRLYCREGVCTPQLAPGDPCTSDNDCADGYCGDGSCSPDGDLGARCIFSSECRDGQVCDSKACVRSKLIGEACDDGLECDSGVCRDNAVCMDSVYVGVEAQCSSLSGQQ